MTNAEKYREEIEKYDGDRFCNDFIKNRIVKDNDCEEKDCNKCILLQFLWLMEEYEEPEEQEVDWRKVAVDTPILVKDYKSEQWERRYFAKYENGIVYAWSNGCTSWTTYEQNDITRWNIAKLAEEGDE